MLSMSYCICENTAIQLKELIDSLESDPERFLDSRSESEQKSFVRLIELCQELMEFASVNQPHWIDEAKREELFGPF